jgi:hypothetical protein
LTKKKPCIRFCQRDKEAPFRGYGGKKKKDYATAGSVILWGRLNREKALPFHSKAFSL